MILYFHYLIYRKKIKNAHAKKSAIKMKMNSFISSTYYKMTKTYLPPVT